jgi:hypothetical protein
MELRNPCEGIDEGAMASFSTVASIVAGIQANEALKLVTGMKNLEGVLILDLLNSKYSIMKLEKNENCFVCGKEKG